MPARFWAKLHVDANDCWVWHGARDSHDYGNFFYDGKYWRAHRLAYFTLVGPTPLPLDHLCRVPACVNPDHLEPVTDRENSLRGAAPNWERYRTNTCKRGHDLTLAYVNADGTRSCRRCVALRAERRRRADGVPTRAESVAQRKADFVPAEMCRNGHVYAEVGVYEYRGKRFCMECRREADRRRHARRTA